MKARPRTITERDNGHRIAESRARKLGALGALTPADERRLARAAALPVAELRRRIAQDSEAPPTRDVWND